MIDLLLVDDEPRVVHALANVLRHHRARYRVRIAGGADDALRLMRERPADIVVTDMRMPGTDGEALLLQTRGEWPASVRIVLSGQTDQASSRRLASLAHLFLAKPIESATLIATLDRVGVVLTRLQSAPLRRLIGSLRKLPVLSRTSQALRERLAHVGATAREVASTVEQSPALTARVLHLANSAFFAAAQPVPSVERAVAIIGFETLQALVLAAELFCDVPRDGGAGILLARLQQRALLCTRIARALTPPGRRLPDAWTAALLHDIGLHAIIAQAPGLLDDVQARVLETGESLLDAQATQWGATHADVGAYLLGLWGFEWDIIDAVGQPATTPVTAPPHDVPDIVRLAAALTDELIPVFPECIATARLAAPPSDDATTVTFQASWRALARDERATLEANSARGER